MAGTWAAILGLEATYGGWQHKVVEWAWDSARSHPTNPEPSTVRLLHRRKKTNLHLAKARFVFLIFWFYHLIMSDARDNPSCSQNMVLSIQASLYVALPLPTPGPRSFPSCVSLQTARSQGPPPCLLHNTFPHLPAPIFPNSLDFSSTFNSPFNIFSHRDHL